MNPSSRLTTRRTAAEISPAGGGGFHGGVVTADGAPVSEAAVLLADGPSHTDLSALTDEAGAFVLGAGELAPGDYRLLAHAPSGQTGSVSARASSGVSTEVRIVVAGQETLIAPEIDG